MLRDKEHPTGMRNIRQRLYKDFPDIDQKDIDLIVDSFWSTRLGIGKYLRGFKSFSVARLFFFIVNPKKEENYNKNKRMKKNLAMKLLMRKRRGSKPRKKKKFIELPDSAVIEKKYYFIGKYYKTGTFASKVGRKKYETYDEAIKVLIHMAKYTHYRFEDLKRNGSPDDIAERNTFYEKRSIFGIFLAKNDELLITKDKGNINFFSNQI